ncbi:MAG: transporter substrate-binding protein, partial [Ilumatobacteraceae bacterium]|nr:transporter substrate-binding protein [Ilumatobacteraceae bacterium]
DAAAGPWRVDTSQCSDPAAAEQPITGTLTIGSIAPQTGGLISAVYAPLVSGFQAYVDHANEARLLGDVQLKVVVADDQGDPALTPAAMGGLIAAGADVVSGILGSANNLAVRSQANGACIPQLMSLGNSSLLGDVSAAPWTMIGLVPVTVETTVYVSSIVRLRGEHARVSLLISDDNDGQTFASSFNAAASDTDVQVVGQQVVEPNVIEAPSNQLLAIAADAPDAIVASLTGAACATFLIELANVRAYYPDWHPAVYMSGGCADPSILSLAGSAGDGVYSSANLLGSEPTFDAAMSALGITTGLAAAGEGWTAAEVTVAILVQAQHSSSGLTRASIMDAARNLSFTPSLARPGVHYTTNGTDDAFPAESLQVIQYHAADQTFADVGPLVAQFES